MKIIDYKIVFSYIAFNLEDKVEKLLADDYQPYGYIFSKNDSQGDAMLCQAMVKYEESTLEKPLMTHVKIWEDPQKAQEISEEEAKPNVLLYNVNNFNKFGGQIELLSCPKCGTKVMKKPKNN